MLKSTKIYIIRHGESKGNCLEIFGGDEPLTENGINQARSCSTILSHITYTACYCSPLKRAIQTAREISKLRSNPVIIDARLRERYYGVLEGTEVKKLLEPYHMAMNNLNGMSDVDKLTYNYAPEMETQLSCALRLSAFLKEIYVKHQNETILAITHGNIMRSLLVYFGFASFSIVPPNSIQNTGYYVLEITHTNITVIGSRGMPEIPKQKKRFI